MSVHRTEGKNISVAFGRRKHLSIANNEFEWMWKEPEVVYVKQYPRTFLEDLRKMMNPLSQDGQSLGRVFNLGLVE
jgi:hypothetical protein